MKPENTNCCITPSDEMALIPRVYTRLTIHIGVPDEPPCLMDWGKHFPLWFLNSEKLWSSDINSIFTNRLTMVEYKKGRGRSGWSGETNTRLSGSQQHRSMKSLHMWARPPGIQHCVTVFSHFSHSYLSPLTTQTSADPTPGFISAPWNNQEGKNWSESRILRRNMELTSKQRG